MMLVSKERAEYLASLSCKYCESINKINDIITYKKAMEFDKNTTEKIIMDLESKVSSLDMDHNLKDLGSYSRYFADEILEVDNYQYVDSYEYDYDGTMPSSMTVYMHEGEDFVLSSLAHKVYAEHIYENLFPHKEHGVSILQSFREWELFLKLMITEDRVISPYRVYLDLPGGTKYTYTFLPMEETLKWLTGYQKEIEILNKVLSKTNGRIIRSYNAQSSMIMEVKPTVLYLETIGEDRLAQELRNHQSNELHLNYVLERSSKRAYGLVTVRKNETLALL